MATAFNQTPAVHHTALVVDDSKIACKVLSGALAKLGFEVDVAHSAEAALKRLAGPLPDIVFMDHLLPGMDGLDAVVRLRAQARTARLPIVMYTSQESEAFAAMARRAGANDIYPKSAEYSALGEILGRLNLTPARPRTEPATSSVVPIRGQSPTPARDARKITRADLLKLLEPSLAAHHARLHQDLLAEFAILERYEERMRRDLFARVDALTKHATDRVDRAFAERRIEREYERRGGARRWWAMAATIAMALGLSLTATWTVGQRNDQLELQGAAMLSMLDAQAGAIDDLDASLLAIRAGSGGAEAVGEPAFAPAEDAAYSPPPARSPTAAAALVAELQSMGILGPVRIETSAGSFCVRSTSTGFQIEVSNLALEDCEALPMRLTAATW